MFPINELIFKLKFGKIGAYFNMSLGMCFLFPCILIFFKLEIRECTLPKAFALVGDGACGVDGEKDVRKVEKD